MPEALRTRGLLLMGTGALVFLGTNAQVLPAMAFFPAVVACLLGVFIFMKGNREATEIEEQRIRVALNPDICNPSLERYAASQAQIDGRSLDSLANRGIHGDTAERTVAPSRETDEIVLYEVDQSSEDETSADFVVTTDVSFPVEIQESRSLAEQLQKLQRLLEDDVINSEEFAIAKAKLLR